MNFAPKLGIAWYYIWLQDPWILNHRIYKKIPFISWSFYFYLMYFSTSFFHMLGWYTMSTYRKCFCQWSRICGSLPWMPIACTKNIYGLSCIEKVGWTMIFGCLGYVLFAFKVGHERWKYCQGWRGFCAHCPLLAWVCYPGGARGGMSWP